uniref:Uncharacterized protein n=2 Tax=Alexandrium monilatum TaxID=311494 RepID=A0A7S4VNV4_9DINO
MAQAWPSAVPAWPLRHASAHARGLLMVVLRRLTIHGLAGARNDEQGVFQALSDQGTLSAGLRLDGPDVEFILGSCEPPAGSFAQGKTEVILADQVLSVFKKIHVLPYKDTFKYNYDFMYHEHIVPYFHTKQVGEFSEGFDFSHEGVRFSVIGVLPEKSYGVVGRETEIFYEGPAVERKVLERLQLLPFEDGLPEKYRPSKLMLDGDALLRDYVRPHFEQRSAPLAPGDVVPIQGVRFKVVACRPSEGGGVGRDTELVCQGVALREAFGPSTGAARPARPKAAAAKAAIAKAAAARGAPAAPPAPPPESDGAGQGGGGCTVS